MSSPEPDILRRGQAIFDRLRGASPEVPADPELPQEEVDEVVEEPVEEADEVVEDIVDEGAESAALVPLHEPEPEVAFQPDPPSVSEIIEEAAANLAPAPPTEPVAASR